MLPLAVFLCIGTVLATPLTGPLPPTQDPVVQGPQGLCTGQPWPRFPGPQGSRQLNPGGRPQPLRLLPDPVPDHRLQLCPLVGGNNPVRAVQ